MRVSQQQSEAWLEHEIHHANSRRRREVYDHRSKRQKQIHGPHCENCERETEYLFPGFLTFKPPANQQKFQMFESVRLSIVGKRAGLCSGSRFRSRGAEGILFGFCKDETMVRVLKKTSNTPEYFHIDFWEPIEKRKKRPIKYEPVSAMVCATCRPPSNWEIQEILEQKGRLDA